MSTRAFAQAISILFALALGIGLLSLDVLREPVSFHESWQAESDALASDAVGADVSSLMMSANPVAASQPAPTPTPTGSPAATASPTTSPVPSPTAVQTSAPGSSGGNSGQSGFFNANMRVMLILILGGVGILLAIVLGIRLRLQEVRRLAAEAQQKEDSPPPA